MVGDFTFRFKKMEISAQLPLVLKHPVGWAILLLGLRNGNFSSKDMNPNEPIWFLKLLKNLKCFYGASQALSSGVLLFGLKVPKSTFAKHLTHQIVIFSNKMPPVHKV